jgi:hypothetical protein
LTSSAPNKSFVPYSK